MATNYAFYKISTRSHDIHDHMEDFTGQGYLANGKGYHVQPTDAPFNRFEVKELVIVDKVVGHTYMSSELFSLLTTNAEWGQGYLKLGNRKFMQVTDEVLQQALDHACYARRSQREQDVAERNLGIVEFLMSL